MVKISWRRFIVIILFIAGLILLALGFYISLSSPIVFGTVATSSIVILLILYFVSRRKIGTKVGIEIKLLVWGLILIYNALVIYTAIEVFIAIHMMYNIPSQIIPPIILTLIGTLSSLFIIVKQYYLFIVVFELLYAMNSNFMNLWLYEISNILMLIIVTIFLMGIAMKYCGKRISFSYLFKEFVINPLSNAFSWLLFAIPFMLVLTSIFVTWNLILSLSFGGWIKLELALVGAICGTLAIIKKLYRGCCMDKLMATTIAIIISISLIYPLGIYSGWIELSLKSLHDLEPILMISFILIAFFIHTPMICLITNKDKCKELNKF